MKVIKPFGILVFIAMLSGCLFIDRDKPVDKSKLIGMDYRIFQDTPAWELAKAVQDEDVKKINAILEQDPGLVNYKESLHGSNLLMLAVLNNDKLSCKALLKKNADVNEYDKDSGASAIIMACRYGSIDVDLVELLLQYGANVNDVEVGERKQGDRTRYTPLMASAAGRFDKVKLLIAKGANVNYVNEFGSTALSQTVMLGYYDITLYLLEQGADHTRRIFHRPVPTERDMYLVDVLRENFFELGSRKYKQKMKIVDFLMSKGVDYRSSPIPDYIKEKAQEKYPDTWEDYLAKY